MSPRILASFITAQGWVALAAGIQAGLGALYFWQFHLLTLESAAAYGLFAFGGGLLFYRIQRKQSFAFRQNLPWLDGLGLICLLGGLMALGKPWLLPVATVCFLTLFYPLKLPGLPRFREVAWLKPVWLGACWTAITYLVPAWVVGQVDPWLLIARFAFFFSLSVAFDLPDTDRDASEGNFTLAHRLRLSVLMRWICLPVLLCIVIHAVLLKHAQDTVDLAWLISSGVYLLVMPRIAQPGVATREFCDLYLDGVMVIAGPIFLVLRVFS